MKTERLNTLFADIEEQRRAYMKTLDAVHDDLAEELGLDEVSDVQLAIFEALDLEAKLYEHEKKFRKLVANRYVNE